MTLVKLVLSLTPARKCAVFLTADTVMVPVAYVSAFAVFNSTVAPLSEVVKNVALMLMLCAAAPALSIGLGVPNFRLKDLGRPAVARLAVLSALLGFLGFVLASASGLGIRPGYHVVFSLIYLVLIVGCRAVMLHILLAIYRRSASVTRVLIYGAGRAGMALAAALRERDDIVPVAFLDDNAALEGLVVAGLPVFPGKALDEIAVRLRASGAILAMPSASAHRQSFLSCRLTRLGLDVQTVPSFAQLIGDEELVDRLIPVRVQSLMSREPVEDRMLAAECRAYSGASVLVSGAGGSIGLELCRQILACGPRTLVLFEVSEPALYAAEREMHLLSDDEVEIVPVLGSIDDATLVARTLRSHAVDTVLHAAAYKHVPLVERNPSAGLANNTLGTATIAQCARDAGVGRFVLISSDKAVRPVNIMGASKRLAELIVQDLATRSGPTRFSIVRFGNVLGSSGSVLPLFQDQIASGGPVTLTDENVTRYFMTIQEAVGLVLQAGSLGSGGEVFVLDMGEPVRIRDLARRLIVASGYTVRDADHPGGDIEIITTGLRPGEKLHEELTLSDQIMGTAHPKIGVVREPFLSEIEMAAALRDLREALNTGDDAATCATINYWVRARVTTLADQRSDPAPESAAAVAKT